MTWIERINGATIFQFCAALSSIIGLVITYFTWIRTKNVEQAVREIRLKDAQKTRISTDDGKISRLVNAIQDQDQDSELDQFLDDFNASE